MKPDPPLLPPRQLEVLQRMVDGQSTTEIAAAMGISFRTVKNHKSAIYERLCVRSDLAAAMEALRLRLVTLELPDPPARVVRSCVLVGDIPVRVAPPDEVTPPPPAPTAARGVRRNDASRKRAEAVELSKQGVNAGGIAERLGVSRRTAYAYLADANEIDVRNLVAEAVAEGIRRGLERTP